MIVVSGFPTRHVSITAVRGKTRRIAIIRAGGGAASGHMPYVTTGEAAKALGVSIRSLQQWAKDGLILPDYVTPGGHMRWDVERVRAELRNPSRYRRGEES